MNAHSFTTINLPMPQISEFCQRWQIVEFALFGSVLRDDFRPDSEDVASLLDISKAAYKILEYKQGLSKSEFMDDDKTQSSILYQLLIVGEATKRISQEFRKQNVDIPSQIPNLRYG